MFDIGGAGFGTLFMPRMNISSLIMGAPPVRANEKMATYEVTYSTKTENDNELSFTDIVLVEAETHEELTKRVVDLILKLGPQGSYYVDRIEGNPYEPPRKKMHPRTAKKIAKDRDDLKSSINALI